MVEQILDWNDLKFFLAIAEAGTLSGATRLVTASQPTLSRRLAELEATLGLKLFERRPDGYKLTVAGEQVHACALQMEYGARGIERDITGGDSSKGHMVVTTTVGLSTSCVTPLLARYQALFPHISIDMIISYDATNVLRRVADIAVRMGEPHADGLEQRHVGTVSFSIYGSVDYLEKNGEPKRIEDLKTHSIIGSSGDISNFMQTKLLRDMSADPFPNFTTDDLTNQVAAVKAGFGLMAFSNHMAVSEPELRRVLTDEFNPSVDVWILTHKGLAQNDRLRSLVDFLADGISENLRSVL